MHLAILRPLPCRCLKFQEREFGLIFHCLVQILLLQTLNQFVVYQHCHRFELKSTGISLNQSLPFPFAILQQCFSFQHMSLGLYNDKGLISQMLQNRHPLPFDSKMLTKLLLCSWESERDGQLLALSVSALQSLYASTANLRRNSRVFF